MHSIIYAIKLRSNQCDGQSVRRVNAELMFIYSGVTLIMIWYVMLVQNIECFPSRRCSIPEYRIPPDRPSKPKHKQNSGAEIQNQLPTNHSGAISQRAKASPRGGEQY